MDKKRAVILNEQRFGLAEQLRQDWVVNAEQGTTVADVIDPGYWSHVAVKMQPYDRIDVRLETGEWILELIVLGVGRNWAQVHIAQKHELQPVGDSMPAAIKHKVEWKGPQIKWCVIRLADNEIIHKNFTEKELAYEAMKNHEKATSI